MRCKYHGFERRDILFYTMVYYAILLFICWNMFCVKLQYVPYNNSYWLPVVIMLYYVYVIVIYDMYIMNKVNMEY